MTAIQHRTSFVRLKKCGTAQVKEFFAIATSWATPGRSIVIAICAFCVEDQEIKFCLNVVVTSAFDSSLNKLFTRHTHLVRSQRVSIVVQVNRTFNHASTLLGSTALRDMRVSQSESEGQTECMQSNMGVD